MSTSTTAVADSHPFISYLADLLARSQTDTTQASFPKYDGLRTVQTDSIERDFLAIVNRMREAEAKLAAVQQTGFVPPTPEQTPVTGSDQIAPPDPLAEYVQVDSPASVQEELVLLKSLISDVVRVCNAVTAGDLSQKITTPVQDVIMTQLKDCVNTMVDKLQQFVDGIQHVSLEVGTEGRLAEGATVATLGGAWLHATKNLNELVGNFTQHVRSIAEVTKAIAHGDLSRRIDIAASGELLELKYMMNKTIAELHTIASEVSRVTTAVASRGMFVGDINVQDLDGEWKEMATNVNSMCTTVRDHIDAVSTVANAATRGDFEQPADFYVAGEFGALKDSIMYLRTQLQQNRTYY